MRKKKMYANASKCLVGAEEIYLLNCFIGQQPSREDPAKVKTIVDWLVTKNQKDLRNWIGLANYLHKYTANYADMARPLPKRFEKHMEWCWTSTQNGAFERVKESLL